MDLSEPIESNWKGEIKLGRQLDEPSITFKQTNQSFYSQFSLVQLNVFGVRRDVRCDSQPVATHDVLLCLTKLLPTSVRGKVKICFPQPSVQLYVPFM